MKRRKGPTADEIATACAAEAQRQAKALAATTVRACALMWPLQSAIIAAMLGADQDFVARTYQAAVNCAPTVAASAIRELDVDDGEAEAFFAGNPFPEFKWPEIADIVGRSDGLPATSAEVH